MDAHAHPLRPFRTQNGVGLRDITYSQGVLVDLTPPTCTARDGVRGAPDLQFSTEGIARVYFACEDPESGAEVAMWGLGTVRGWDDAVALQGAPVWPLPLPDHVQAQYDATVSEYHQTVYRLVDGEVAAPSTQLLDGVRYYGVLYAENGAGSFAWATTNGQVHDSSAPTLVFAMDVQSAAQPSDIGFSANATHWGVRFRVRDPHTGVASVAVKLMTAAAGSGAAVELDSVEVPALLSGEPILVVRPVPQGPLAPKQRVWARIVTANSVGLSATYDTDGWLVDASPPEFVMPPSDGVDAAVDAVFQQSAGSLAACWQARDEESQVDHYLISARVQDGGSVGPALTEWVHVPRRASQQSGTRNGAPFVEGVTCAWTSGFKVVQGQTYQVRHYPC